MRTQSLTLQFPYKVGKIREPQAQFEKRPIRAVSKPASQPASQPASKHGIDALQIEI